MKSGMKADEVPAQDESPPAAAPSDSAPADRSAVEEYRERVLLLMDQTAQQLVNSAHNAAFFAATSATEEQAQTQRAGAANLWHTSLYLKNDLRLAIEGLPI